MTQAVSGGRRLSKSDGVALKLEHSPVTAKSGFCFAFGKGVFPVVCVTTMWEVTSVCHSLSGTHPSFPSTPHLCEAGSAHQVPSEA